MRNLLIALAVVGGVTALAIRYPYAIQQEESRMHLLYLVLLLLVMVFNGGIIRRIKSSNVARDTAIWFGILLLVVLGYSYRDAPIIQRMTGELMPSQAQQSGEGTIAIRASDGGHFNVEALVNQVPVRFMIDTGATDIVLSPKDAERAGIALADLSFDRAYSTANGYGSGAKVMLHSISVAGFTLHDMPASVNKAEMNGSLLGMSFLKRLHSFRVEGNTLLLVP